jgi:hypothetical protein
MSAKDYYDGGCRVVLGGVPVRLARKPSKTALALMRGSNDPFCKPTPLEGWQQEQAYLEAMGRV